MLGWFEDVLFNVKPRISTECKTMVFYPVKCCTDRTDLQLGLCNWASAPHLSIVSKYGCTKRACPFKQCICHMLPAAVNAFKMWLAAVMIQGHGLQFSTSGPTPIPVRGSQAR